MIETIKSGANYQKVLNFFKGDHPKTVLWFESRNPLLGNIAPIHMILIGRAAELTKFVDQQLDGGC